VDAYSPIPPGYKFENNLDLNDRNEDVKYLQKFLEYQEFFPADTNTGYFGNITNKAVIKFQEEYSDEILKPWGISYGTGHVGRTTIAKLNKFLDVFDENNPSIPWPEPLSDDATGRE